MTWMSPAPCAFMAYFSGDGPSTTILKAATSNALRARALDWTSPGGRR